MDRRGANVPQLVGLECVRCLHRISSILDGTFCECGNPVHRRCLEPPPMEVPEGRCPQCGGERGNEVAREARHTRGAEAQRELGRTAPAAYPVGRVCPNCLCDQFTRERPASWVAYAWDRRCTECGTRYTPPTPLWAGVVFVMVGIALLAFSGVGIVAGDVCVALLGVVGILALAHGIRGLVRLGSSS